MQPAQRSITSILFSILNHVFIQVNCFILTLIFSFAFLFVSLRAYLRSLFHADKVLIEKPYQGQKIVFMALYEKGVLRNDIKRFLSMAKRMGYYVIAVNSLKLLNPPSEGVDCYIERFNFGRDFGSYKAGFLYLFQQGYLKQCPRLLMVNDSVFYESSRSADFLSVMMHSDIEVLGAIESLESSYHLGSFGMSFDQRVLNHKEFEQFWRRYRNSESRPHVIKYGEIHLSRCLMKIVSSDTQLQAAYDVNFVSRVLDSTQELSTLFKLKYQANFEQVYQSNVWDAFFAKEFSSFHWPNQSIRTLPVLFQIHELDLIKDIISNMLKSSIDLHAIVDQYIKSVILESFQYASQIHHNCLLLFHLGLPIIKLDAYYRGALSVEEVKSLSRQMEQDESMDFERLMFRRPLGKRMLYGINKLMFSTGFL